MKPLARIRQIPSTVKSGYNYSAEQKRQFQGYVSQHPRCLVTLVVYAALMWPLLVLMIMVLIAFGISVFVSSMTITLLMAPVVVGLLQTAMVVLGVSYTVVWITEQCARKTRERRRARKEKQRAQLDNSADDQCNNSSDEPSDNQPSSPQPTSNQPCNQPTNQPTNQVNNQQFANKPSNQRINQLNHPPVNQPANQSRNQPGNQPVNYPAHQFNVKPPVHPDAFEVSGYANVFNDHLDQPFNMPPPENLNYANHPLVLDSSAEVVNRRLSAPMNQ